MFLFFFKITGLTTVPYQNPVCICC